MHYRTWIDMFEKRDRYVTVLSNELIAQDIFKMVITCADFPEEIRGGQFIHIAIPDKAHPLRRPFCVADYDMTAKTVTVVYAVVGEGTKVLSAVKSGEILQALFPLGNGFFLGDNAKKIVLLGGGLGTAVLPAIPTAYPDREYYTFLGFGNKNKAILVDELKAKGEVYIATDDGSLGEKGFVTSLLASKMEEIKPDVILCCGPEVMYKALAKELAGNDTPIYVSLEKRMGCGVGACLVCNCKIKTADGEKYLRACVEGPVFRLDEVVL